MDPRGGRFEIVRVGIAIDTLAYARRLREAGFSEQQAEGQAEALAAAMTRGEMADLERRMTMRLGGISVASVSVVSALVKLL